MSSRSVSGGIEARFECHGLLTRIQDLRERDGYRMRVLRNASACEGVIINTGGGVVAGDRVAHHISAGREADITLSTTAAERIYRSTGSDASIAVDLRLHPNAAVAWLPQETILYNAAKLNRSIAVEMCSTARVLLVETTLFGRTAMNETVETGAFTDRWRIRRDGCLVFAETTALTNTPAAILQKAAIGGGITAMATLVYVALDAEARLSSVRAALNGMPCNAAASAWNGLLCVRAIAANGEDLRRAFVPAILALRGTAMPRVWGL